MNKLVLIQSDQMQLVMELILNELEPDLPSELLEELCTHIDFIDRLQQALEAVRDGMQDPLAELIESDPHMRPYLGPRALPIVTIHTTHIPGMVLLELGYEPRVIPGSSRLG